MERRSGVTGKDASDRACPPAAPCPRPFPRHPRGCTRSASDKRTKFRLQSGEGEVHAPSDTERDAVPGASDPDAAGARAGELADATLPAGRAVEDAFALS